MTHKRKVPSIGEVLETAAIYGAQLGPERTKQLLVSDQWGDGRTTATLLLKEPGRWEHLLNDEGTRERTYQALLVLQQDLANAP